MTARFSHSSRHASPGFTLVEMLLVVAIIVLLLSLLLPALGRSKEVAYIATCKSRMRQLFYGHTAYASDHGGRFPHYNFWLWNGPQGGDSSRWVEHGEVWNYVRDGEMYFCPKDDKTRTGSSSIGSPAGPGNHAIHTYVRIFEPHRQFRDRLVSGGIATEEADRYSWYLRPQSIRPGAFAPTPGSALTAGDYDYHPQGPAELGMLFEEATSSTDTIPVGTDSVLLNDGHSYFTYVQDMMTTRHLKGGHVFYWDGHAILMDGQRFNDWPVTKDPYAESVVFGIPLP